MKELKLTIDLLPKGAWGNNLSSTLSKKDWDLIRENCYNKANHRCEICGYAGDLDAHEEWDFNILTKTQKLKNIIALCSACHGVKHMRNSQRMGYGENAKRHFLKVNKCSELDFASACFEAESLFEERNAVFRWKIKADLTKFGGTGIEAKERNIPIIQNPYENIDFNNETFNTMKTLFTFIENRDGLGPPSVKSICVDNYQGSVTVTCEHANKIDWSLDEHIIKTKYNISGKFVTVFKVENLEGTNLRFRLTGDGGELFSKTFKLVKGE